VGGAIRRGTAGVQIVKNRFRPFLNLFVGLVVYPFYIPVNAPIVKVLLPITK
jgi:hypothetical protein